MKKTLIVITLVFLSMSCKTLTPEQKVQSEAADATPVQRTGDCGITLNNEKKGTLTDLSPLKTTMGEIMVDRQRSGYPENTVFVLADGNISSRNLAELANAINKGGGKAYFPRPQSKSEKVDEEQINRPNPFMLVVKCGETSAGKVPGVESDAVRQTPFDVIESFSSTNAYSPTFEYITDLYDLRLRRSRTGGIEISADDKYFVNDVSDPAGRQDIESLQVIQRPVAAADLKTEAAKFVGDGEQILIIASENSSYAGLTKIFEAADRPGLEFRVLIRKHDLKKP